MEVIHAQEDVPTRLRRVNADRLADLVIVCTGTLRQMITHRLSLAETEIGFQLVADAGESIKVVIEPHRCRVAYQGGKCLASRMSCDGWLPCPTALARLSQTENDYVILSEGNTSATYSPTRCTRSGGGMTRSNRQVSRNNTSSKAR